MNGLLVIDKSGGRTSRETLDRVKRWFPRNTRIGHAGTLDPLATGVLVVCVGSATRLADYVQEMDKSYRTTIRLGVRSDTDDADGTVEPVPDARVPSEAEIAATLADFIGEVPQVPPAYSALKVGGKRLHKLARRGVAPVLDARPVQIAAIRLTRYEYPVIEAEIDCGKGTYIRAIARDLGDKLGCGGIVESLCRTRVGPFRVEDGIDIEAERTTARERLLPLALAVSALPRVDISPDLAHRIRCGQDVHIPGLEVGAWVSVFDGSKLVGVVSVGRNSYVHGETIFRY